MLKKVNLIFIVFWMLLSACRSGSVSPVIEETLPLETIQEELPVFEITSTKSEPTVITIPTSTPEPSPVVLSLTPTEPPVLDPLPPEPQDVEFQAEDGFVINGRYYPAGLNPAPIIVLMHWAVGDMEDWNEIAFWLQNRGLSGTSTNLNQSPWLDPSWFPPMLEGQSFGVFTFSFRECKAGCKNFVTNRPLWQLDARAALETAMSLEGVDPLKIVAIGASIGGDGATDGCYLHNQVFTNSCLGALSLSPGDYLTIPYADAVATLMNEEPPKVSWCLWAVEDIGAAGACNSASGEQYMSFEWSGGSHGMDLIRPEINPSVMLKILDFLTMIFDL